MTEPVAADKGPYTAPGTGHSSRRPVGTYGRAPATCDVAAPGCPWRLPLYTGQHGVGLHCYVPEPAPRFQTLAEGKAVRVTFPDRTDTIILQPVAGELEFDGRKITADSALVLQRGDKVEFVDFGDRPVPSRLVTTSASAAASSTA